MSIKENVSICIGRRSRSISLLQSQKGGSSSHGACGGELSVHMCLFRDDDVALLHTLFSTFLWHLLLFSTTDDSIENESRALNALKFN